MTDRSWLFNGSVENEATFKPLCQRIEAQFKLPARRLFRYFARGMTPTLVLVCGKNFRGLHVLFSGRQMLPLDLLHGFFHPLEGFSFLSHVTFEETIAFDNLIYIRRSTCDDITGFVTTYAHELQHFVQHGTMPRVLAVNGVLREQLKGLEPTAIATDVPSEKDANIKSKQVAEIICGVEAVRTFAEQQIGLMEKRGEYDEQARWIFFRDVPSSTEYDMLKDTVRLVEKYKTRLNFGIDVNQADWWLGTR